MVRCVLTRGMLKDLGTTVQGFKQTHSPAFPATRDLCNAGKRGVRLAHAHALMNSSTSGAALGKCFEMTARGELVLQHSTGVGWVCALRLGQAAATLLEVKFQQSSDHRIMVRTLAGADVLVVAARPKHWGGMC